MKKEVVARVEGVDIRVVNTWFSGAKLYIDGDCKDTSNSLFVSSGAPTLAGTFDVNGQKHRVEVYMRAILTVQIKIMVDGVMVAGEMF